MRFAIKSYFGFAILFVVLTAFNLPKNITKKVNKELVGIFETEDIILTPINIPTNINNQLEHKIGDFNLFKVEQEKVLKGYVYIDKAPSKTDEFDYLIVFDTNFIILKTKVLVYREDYGGEIGSKRWLKQFIGKSKQDNLQAGKNIMAISGATISVNSMTLAINNVLKNIAVLQEQNIL